VVVRDTASIFAFNAETFKICKVVDSTFEVDLQRINNYHVEKSGDALTLYLLEYNFKSGS
jgi:hypothetical protein